MNQNNKKGKAQKDIIEVFYRNIGADPRIGQEHLDNSIEIIQFWSNGGYFIAKGNIFPITPGTIIMINGIHPHYSNPAQINSYNRNKIVISYDLFQQLSSICGLKDQVDEYFLKPGGLIIPPAGNSTDSHEIDQLFLNAEKNYPTRPDSCIGKGIIIDSIIRILIYVFSRVTRQDNSIKENNTLTLLTEYLNKPYHPTKKLSLDDLCQELHISPSYASHLFKKLTNKSIAHYIMELRIAEAKKLLLTTNMKVCDIAEQLHFSDSTNFCKTFKKYTQSTPNTYRATKGLSIKSSE